MPDQAAEYKIQPSFVDGWKRIFLGKPMITDELKPPTIGSAIVLTRQSGHVIGKLRLGRHDGWLRISVRATVNVRNREQSR